MDTPKYYADLIAANLNILSLVELQALLACMVHAARRDKGETK